MNPPRAHVHAELWLALLKEQLGISARHLSKDAVGQIEFRSRDADGDFRWLGAILLSGPGAYEEIKQPGLADCQVIIDDRKARAFFMEKDVEPGTFEVRGRSELFEHVLSAIEAKPPVQSWLQTRSSK